MSFTNFARLTNEELTIWSMDLWKQARNKSFLNRFAGKSTNSMVHHIDELTKTDKGARAVITLLADLEGDGIAGDRTLEGNEEAMKSYDQDVEHWARKVSQRLSALPETRHEAPRSGLCRGPSGDVSDLDLRARYR